jgi:micrococcal nuclease
MALVGAPNFGLQDPRLWFYRAKVLRVLSGDTVIVLLDKGFGDYGLVRLQLTGVAVPDDRATARKAATRLEELLLGQEVVVQSARTKKLGRWLGRIFLPGQRAQSVNQLLLDEGLVVDF